MLSALLVCEGLARRVDAISTAAIGALDDRGAFLSRGYRSVARALADLLGWDYMPARTRATVAADVHCRTARRLSPEAWAGAETQLAEHACTASPGDLLAFGTELITLLDQDGPEPHDDQPLNELRLTRHRSGAGGSLKGRFEDPALFDAIAAVIDAKAKPLTADDDRSAAQRQAEALADVCGYVLDHGDVPDAGAAARS